MPNSQQFSFSQSITFTELGMHPSHQFWHFWARHVVSGMPDGILQPPWAIGIPA